MTIDQLKKNKLKIAGAGAVIVFAVLLYAFLDEPARQEQEQAKPDHLVEFEGSELVENKDGKLVWRLTADKIMIDPETELMYFEQPKGLFIDEDGTELTITSPQGIVDRKRHTLEVRPPVDARTNRNDTLQTEGSVYYNMNTHTVKGGKVVMHRHDNTSLRADAFETTTSLDKVTLTGRAQVTKGEQP